MEPPHKHLKRLDRIIPSSPIFSITVVQAQRSPILATPEFHSIFEEVWVNLEALHGWTVGPFVIMPDHVHFLCRGGRENATPLSTFIGKWKEWTAKYANRRLRSPTPLWQREFFDHLLRSSDSPGKTADYFWYNPVRAGIVEEPEDWPYRGNLGGW